MTNATGLDRQTAIDGFAGHPQAFVGREFAFQPPPDVIVALYRSGLSRGSLSGQEGFLPLLRSRYGRQAALTLHQ